MNQIKRSGVLVLGLFAFASAVALTSHYNTATQAQGLLPPSNVNVVNKPTVTVANTVTAPALVRDVDNLARQPFQATRVVRFDNQIGIDVQLAEVPAGKRLFIQFVTVHLNVDVGRKPYLSFRTNNQTFQYYLPAVALGTYANSIISSGAQDVFTAAVQTELFSDPGTTVNLEIRTDGTTALGGAWVSISGYLVDA